jgi:hypothetical protein
MPTRCYVDTLRFGLYVNAFNRYYYIDVLVTRKSNFCFLKK